MYGVNVEQVNTAIMASKPKNRSTKIKQLLLVEKRIYKKAIVKVAQGEINRFL
jgi:ribosomal protein L23